MQNRINGLHLAIRLTLLLLVASAAPANAEWRRAETDNFIVYADASEEVITFYVRNLERFDAVLRHFTGLDPDPAQVKLRIYLVPDLQRLQRRMGGSGYIGGIYIPDMRGPYVTAPIFGFGTVFHEYVHHFMLQHAPAAYPIWYREGFAEFFSTVGFDEEGHAILGRFPFGRSDDLEYSRRYSFEDVLTESENTNPIALYAQSWLLVHHSIFHAETGRMLARYLDLINRGTAGAQAYRETFANLDDLEDLLDDYGRGNMPISTTAQIFEAGDIRITEIPEDEADVLLLYPRRRAYLEREVVSAVRNHPNNPQGHAELAQLRLAQDRLADAIAAADAALALDPDQVEANVFKGTALLRRAAATGDVNDPRWLEARALFQRANRADPQYPLALLRYYQSFPDFENRPEHAQIALEQAFLFVPQNNETRLQLAIEFLRAGRFDEARFLAQPIVSWPHATDRMTNVARSVIDAATRHVREPDIEELNLADFIDEN